MNIPPCLIGDEVTNTPTISINQCGDLLTSSNATLTWTDSDPVADRIYRVLINGQDLGYSTSNQFIDVTGLPVDGSQITKTMTYSDDNGQNFVVASECQCTAHTDQGAQDGITIDQCDDVLQSDSATITWIDQNPVDGRIYRLLINSQDFGYSTTNRFINVSNLPVDGSQITKTMTYSDDDGQNFIFAGECQCTAFTSDCSGDIDCERSESSFEVFLNGDPAPLPLEHGNTYTISNDWAKCDGTRVDSGNTIVLSGNINGQQQAATFLGAAGVVNNYSFRPLLTDSGTLEFQWGKTPNAADFCTISFDYLYDPDTPPVGTASDWPLYNGSNPPCVEANSAGEAGSFTYNGKSIDYANLDVDNDPPYAKKASITRDGGNGELVLLGDGQVRNLLTKQLVGTLPFPPARARASWSVPDEFWGFNGQNLVRWNAVTNQQTSIDLSGPSDGGLLTHGVFEGNWSGDMSRVLVTNIVGNANEVSNIIALDFGVNGTNGAPVTYNPAAILADAANIYGGSYNVIDAIGVSPSGNYIVATCEHSTNVNRNAYVVYDWGFTNPQRVGDPFVRASHGSWARDVNGQEIFAQLHWDDVLVWYPSDPGEVYAMDWGYHGHVSGRPDRNDFVISSTGGSTSTVSIGEFDPAKFNTNGPKASDDFQYLGNHYEPTSPTTRRIIGCFENEGSGYEDSAVAALSFNGLAAVAGANTSTNYAMCVEAN